MRWYKKTKEVNVETVSDSCLYPASFVDSRARDLSKKDCLNSIIVKLDSGQEIPLKLSAIGSMDARVRVSRFLDFVSNFFGYPWKFVFDTQKVVDKFSFFQKKYFRPPSGAICDNKNPKGTPYKSENYDIEKYGLWGIKS